MEITNIRYYYDQGYPTMAATIDGRPATFIAETKPTIHEAGLVFLGSQFEDVVPPIRLTVNDQPTILRGFSNDPELFELFTNFASSSREQFERLVEQSS